MKAIFTLFLTILTFAGWAQTRLSGKVADSKGVAIPGANVYLKGTYDGASSDADGQFSFISDETGKQILVIQAIGYKHAEESVDLQGAAVNFKATLQETINLLKAVTITAGAMEAGDEKKSVVLKPIDILTTSGAMGDITGAFQTLPGTSTVGNDGRLFVRGGDASETSIYMDGMQVGNAFGTAASNVPTRTRFSPNLFKGSFFSTGGYSAEFGQALSSTLALNSLDMPLRNQGDLSILSVGGGYTHTLVGKRNALTASANYVNLAPYQSIVKQDFDWEKAPENWDTEIALKQKWGKAGFVKAYFHTEGNNMTIWQKIPGEQGRGRRVGIKNQYSYGNISFRQAGKHDWFFTGGLASSFNRDRFNLDYVPVRQVNQVLHGKLVAIKDFNPQFSLKNGLEYFSKSYSEALPNDGKKRDMADHQFNHFIETSYYFNNNVMAVAGLRTGYSMLAKQLWVTPRFSVAYKLNEGQVSFAAGKFKQLPEEKLRLLDNNLKNAGSDHYILNYFFANNNRTLRAETFYKTYENLVTYTGVASAPESIGQQGSGYARGFDFFYRDRQTVKKTDFWITYSFVNSRRRFANYETRVQPSFAPKHNGSVVVKHFVGRVKSQLGSSWSWNSGYTYTNPNEQGEMQHKTSMYSNLSLSWSYLPKPNVILHVACSNVLGRDNVFGYQYAATRDESGSFVSQPVGQGAKRFAVVALFITLSKDKTANQLNNL
ncbi:MAG TPA: TonB-dependent receptor [Dyadobacter sp.]|jgi:hypothetical protein|nr:TonB-dependent receptor [Dyadobacter sp.]